MYHIPVMLNESIEGLNIKPNGTYVDVTFGGGGHSRRIMECLGEGGHLYAFDQDEDAAKNVIDDNRFTFIQQNFRYMKNFLQLYCGGKVDGILADLGVSSYQLDNGERGFSYHKDAYLDMRMSKSGTSAADLVNTLSENELKNILYTFGEEKFAPRIAQAIVREREKGRIETTLQLAEILLKEGVLPFRCHSKEGVLAPVKPGIGV